MTNPEELISALNEHYKKWGFSSFKDECYLTVDRYADDTRQPLIVEFVTPWSRRNGIGGIDVTLSNYQASLKEWIAEECRMQDVESLTEEEARKAEDDMNREHIMIMYEKAVNAARYHKE